MSRSSLGENSLVDCEIKKQKRNEKMKSTKRERINFQFQVNNCVDNLFVGTFYSCICLLRSASKKKGKFRPQVLHLHHGSVFYSEGCYIIQVVTLALFSLHSFHGGSSGNPLRNHHEN
jgi:hypothetical protein